MRGALLRRQWAPPQSRIIPAYAGSTWKQCSASSASGDHPRVCGEHVEQAVAGLRDSRIIPAYAGSTDLLVLVVPRDSGIIPAYAGGTRRQVDGEHPERDHPRVCGEHNSQLKSTLHPHGSSPRMRGARDWRRALVHLGGIIPAYAGSTENVNRLFSLNWDHPRVCGEHPHRVPPSSPHPGSSPRMRGALADLIDPTCHVGIIPAYAGSTRSATIASSSASDHPRV